ncbi:PLP-dependent transferase [Streptomyces sp. NPDC057543]|uniref:PLP-dependent transferase n=1 Tax=Streptomyces sp. NPDC057543 TaxID=3346163 RepID=UPI0036A9F5F8
MAKVHYPGLASHPQHKLAASQMSGFGGVLGIEFTGGFETADAFLGKLRYSLRSASLGGVESLAVHPASMWRGMLSEVQIAESVPLGLVRLAVGTEDTARRARRRRRRTHHGGERLNHRESAGHACGNSPTRRHTRDRRWFHPNRPSCGTRTRSMPWWSDSRGRDSGRTTWL